MHVLEQERQSSTSQAALPPVGSATTESHPAVKASAAVPADPVAAGTMLSKTGATVESVVGLECCHVMTHHI